MTTVPPDLESLELEAGATLVEQHMLATLLFMRTVSGALVAYRQLYNEAVANHNGLAREWSLHGCVVRPTRPLHPPPHAAPSLALCFLAATIASLGA
jgi:hypothetical protein